ncbi:hypothetical protein ES703_118008 [subsurface metagenome]
MKVARNFTIDLEIVQKMQNMNASELINRLLHEHFQVYSAENTLLDEKTATIKQLLKKKSQFMPKLRLLKSGMNSILITILKFGLKLVKKNQILMKFLHMFITEDSKKVQKISKEDGNYKINTENC